MNSNSVLKNFCEDHHIRIIDTNKRAYRYHKINVDYFSYEYDYNKVTQTIVQDTEPLYTVEISESELKRIAEFESQVFNNMKEHGHYHMFEVLMEQKQKEKYLRDKYSAVKKAYEQYSMMLKLAQSGEL
jgi:hypothetical protein